MGERPPSCVGGQPICFRWPTRAPQMSHPRHAGQIFTVRPDKGYVPHGNTGRSPAEVLPHRKVRLAPTPHRGAPCVTTPRDHRRPFIEFSSGPSGPEHAGGLPRRRGRPGRRPGLLQRDPLRQREHRLRRGDRGRRPGRHRPDRVERGALQRQRRIDVRAPGRSAAPSPTSRADSAPSPSPTRRTASRTATPTGWPWSTRPVLSSSSCRTAAPSPQSTARPPA